MSTEVLHASAASDALRSRICNWPLVEVACWLLFYVVALTLVHEFSHGPGNLHNDTLEAYAWGKELQLGYHKHPPFWAWVAYAWYLIFPASDWAAYLLSSINAAIGLCCTWLIGRRYLPDEQAMAAFLGLMITAMYLCFAQRFNANTVLMSLWPATTLAVLRAVDSNRLLDGMLAGVLAALCLLSKYQSVLFLAPLGASVFFLKESAAPYVGRAALACYAIVLLMLLPHAVWLARHDYLPFVYAEITTGRPFAVVVREAVVFVLASLLFLGPAIFGYAWAAGRTHRSIWRACRGAFRGDRRVPALLAFGTPVLTLAICLARSTTVKPAYATPMFSMLPIWLAMAPGLPFDRAALVRIRRLAAGCIVASLIISPIAGGVAFAAHARLATRPKAEIARAVTAEWHRRYGTPLRIVAGDQDYAIAAPFYSPDHPSYLIGLDARELTDFHIPLGGGISDPVLRQSPWVSREAIARDGMAIVCSEELWLSATGCDEEAAHWADPDTQRFDLKLAKRFLGMAGPAYEFHVYFLPPRIVPKPVHRLGPGV
ncbi:MAG: hypothetical protein QOK29_2574 [Rhodospirillaceae bacterium]|nr:hypothetical protein [Rhodospirillaceae bacterium]